MGTRSYSDGYIRLYETQLGDLSLDHLTSAIDMSISLPEEFAGLADIITGHTEWVAPWQGREISIGWDWACINDMIRLIHADEIRSNIRLISKDDVPTSSVRTRTVLVDWIETLSWRDGGVRALVQRNRPPTQ